MRAAGADEDTMRKLMAPACAVALLLSSPAPAQRYARPDGTLRVALAQQPFSPTGKSPGPRTMAQGGIQRLLSELGASVRVEEAALTSEEDTEYAIGGGENVGQIGGPDGTRCAVEIRTGRIQQHHQ